ncbi:MAG: helix-turn-helix domain-containing protein [Oscillospiraceae bacterium]|nr:helix-turn-helix domain-containing protein [Oscillospiraceae bacterium]
MKLKTRFKELRKGQGLSQEEMAQKLSVTRQAVSRWETGETVPCIDTLSIMSKTFGISINTLLGQPRELYCQACGMPLREDGSIARTPDGRFDEEHCRWCVAGGQYVGPETMEEMIEVCVPHMKMPEDAARDFLRKQLPTLKHWRDNRD